MVESEIREREPQSAESILAPLGLTPEQLLKKHVLTVSEGPALSVEGATISVATTKTYDDTNELVEDEKLASFDYLLTLGRVKEFETDVNDPGSLGLLAAAVRSLKNGGELRINADIISWMDEEERAEIVYEFTSALDAESLDVRTTFNDTKDGKNSFLVVTREIKE